MAKLDDLIQQKQQRDEDWKAKKTAEREELGQLSDDAVMRVTSEPGAYLHYLDTQAINPRYSASNVMLAMAQNPEITYINSLEVWNRLGRSVNRDENGMKIRVSDTYVKDGREYHGYKIGRVFDISQTHGKAGVPALSLKDNTPEMDAALRRLLDSSPVPVVTSSTMYLTAKDDPTTIPTADFEREGRTYTLLDLLKNDQTETDTREHIEVVTLESKTKDMVEILKMLEPKLEVKTEDGYEGVLSLDHTTIQVEAAGYGTSSRTVTAERTYPNLSDADVSLVPKSVNENGRTLTLADVSWQEAAVDPTDGYDIPIRYTAVASYTGTATSKYATGYTVTADYKGDVTRTSCDTVIYTAVFSSVGAAASSKSGVDFNWLWLLLPVGAAALGGCGYAGYKGYKHYINKKRGYAA